MYTCPQVQASLNPRSVFLSESPTHCNQPLVNLIRSYQPSSSVHESHPALGVNSPITCYYRRLDIALLTKAMEVGCRASYTFEASALQGFVTRREECCTSGFGVVGYQ